MAANIDMRNYWMYYILILFAITYMLSILYTRLGKINRLCIPLPQSMTTSKTVTWSLGVIFPASFCNITNCYWNISENKCKFLLHLLWVMYILIMVFWKSAKGESVAKSRGYFLKFYPITVTVFKSSDQSLVTKLHWQIFCPVLISEVTNKINTF